MTTTHVSAGRRHRQRLRRTLLVTTVLVLGGGAGGYAAWQGHDPDITAAGGSSSSADHSSGASSTPTGTRQRTKPPRRPVSSTAGTDDASKSAGAKDFAPVLTDRIPTPTTRLSLSAPIPGTTNMQGSAAEAFTRAFADARTDGLRPEIRSAWRSAEWQQTLFDRAVARYGSRVEASKWVLSPARSAHVKGYAVDVHPQAVAGWLETHGPAYGLCRTYDNEWWHFEYLATSTCPARLPTAAG